MKPKTEGPAAYVFPADDPRPGPQAELLRMLQLQGCEISRATAPFTVTHAGQEAARARDDNTPPARQRRRERRARRPTAGPRSAAEQADAPETRTFPAGRYVVRMDQPYSRIADMLLDYQYWAPDDPQRNLYDDTGWTFGELFNVKVVRVTDVKVLDAAMERVKGDVPAPGGVDGTRHVFVINHNADPSLVTLRYRFKDAQFDVAEEPFEAAGRSSIAGRSSSAASSAGDLERRRPSSG